MKTIGVMVLVTLAVVISTAARSDIVVFKNGTYQEGTIKSITEQSVTMKSAYGDLPYARTLIQSVHRSVSEQPGQEYYNAGLAMLQLHKKQTAKKLFKQAAGYDERYGTLGAKALQGYTPQPSSDVASRLRPTPSEGMNARLPIFRVQCALCGGTGKVEYKISSVAALHDDSPLMGFA